MTAMIYCSNGRWQPELLERVLQISRGVPAPHSTVVEWHALVITVVDFILLRCSVLIVHYRHQFCSTCSTVYCTVL